MKSLLLILVLFISINAKAQLTGFTLTGNPEDVNGATWTYQATVNDIVYDLQGILFKPNTGASKYPAVIINHGTGGNVNGYSKTIAKKMVQWGYVCIATNLCHSSNVPEGSPGLNTLPYYGASIENVQRSMKCWDILASVGYVDTNCIAAFGHSRWAWATTALVGLNPDKFSVAAHTAGGIDDNPNSTSAKSYMALAITAPYQMHHGDNDNTVLLSQDVALNSIFNTTNIVHQLNVYNGYTHAQIAQDSLMFAKTQAWFNQYIGIAATGINDKLLVKQPVFIYPNPTSDYLQINSNGICNFQLFNINGQLMISKTISGNDKIDATTLSTGIYMMRIQTNNDTFNQKIVIGK